MLYRDVLVALGGRAPAFLGAPRRDRLREQIPAVYALYEEYGPPAMTLADEAGTYAGEGAAHAPQRRQPAVLLTVPGLARRRSIAC